MKKSVFITLIIIFLGLCITSAFLFFKNNDFFYLNIPEKNDITSIFLNDKEIIKQDSIDTIINTLTNNGKGRKCRQESTSDKPEEAEDLLKIEFNLKDEDTVTVYTYKQQYKYLIEQPYNGVYVITEKEFNVLKELSK